MFQQLQNVIIGYCTTGLQLFFTNGMMGNRRLVDGAPSQTTQLIAWNFLRKETHYNHHNATNTEYDESWNKQTKLST